MGGTEATPSPTGNDVLYMRYAAYQQQLTAWFENSSQYPNPPVLLTGKDQYGKEIQYYGWPPGKEPTEWQTTIQDIVPSPTEGEEVKTATDTPPAAETMPSPSNPKELREFLLKQNPSADVAWLDELIKNAQVGATTMTPLQTNMATAYLNIWGEDPPDGYIESQSKNMNLTQFIQKQKDDPAYKKTQHYETESEVVAMTIAEAFGKIPAGDEASVVGSGA